MKDLLVLVADLDMEVSVAGILKRSQSLSIRPIEFDILRHPNRDNGCCTNAVNFLSPFVRKYRYSLVLFDHEGSGREKDSVEDIASELQKALESNGWEARTQVVVIKPELEAWIWSDSPQVATCLNWKAGRADLDKWLVEREFLVKGEYKPTQPKEAFKAILKATKKPLTVDTFKQLAESVSLQRCQDPSFNRLVETLKEWFPA